MCEVLYEGKFAGVEKEWCNEMKNGQKLKLGDATPCHPKKYSRGTSIKGEYHNIMLLHAKTTHISSRHTKQSQLFGTKHATTIITKHNAKTTPSMSC